MSLRGGDLHGVNRVVSRFRKIEIIVEGRRGIRLQVHGKTPRVKAGLEGDRSHRDLQEEAQLAGRGCGVGEHDLATIGDGWKELVLHKVVQPLVAHVTISGIRPVKTLAEQDLAGIRRLLRRLDLLMKQKDRTAGLEGEGAGLDPGFMLGRLEGKVNDGKGQHHLGKVAGGVDDVAGKERLVRRVRCIVIPEGVYLDEILMLGFNGKLVVVVFRPFLRRLELAEELAHPFAFVGSCSKESSGSFATRYIPTLQRIIPIPPLRFGFHFHHRNVQHLLISLALCFLH